ncbi:hypothetical protein HDU76_010909, partial [Blyttiomyces sp. JEL0837]
MTDIAPSTTTSPSKHLLQKEEAAGRLSPADQNIPRSASNTNSGSLAEMARPARHSRRVTGEDGGDGEREGLI